MYGNARGSYMVYTGKKWKNVEVDERKWAFNYRKYLDMWNLDAPKFFAQMLGLNVIATVDGRLSEWIKDCRDERVILQSCARW